MVCIIHHLGIGDQLMVNGMVRHFLEKEKVVLVAQKIHEESIRFMYRDTNKIDFIFTGTDPQEIWTKVKESGHKPLALATYSVGDDFWKFMVEGQGKLFSNWAYGVYIQAGINPYYMYSKFKVLRNDDQENAIVEKLKLPKDYIFVHDGKGEKECTNCRKDLHIVRPDIDTSPNIFNYLKVIKGAKEIHCMNSSYAWLVNMFRIGTKNTNFFHTELAYREYTKRDIKIVFDEDLWTFI